MSGKRLDHKPDRVIVAFMIIKNASLLLAAMEGVRFLRFDLDLVCLAEQEASDCFFETPDFTFVAKMF